jgi:ATP-dependent RNA helicase DDX3X
VPVVSALQNVEGTEDNEEKKPQINIDQRGVLPRAIILAPTRELASQIHVDARRLTFGSNLRCVCVYGGNDIRAQLTELSQGCEMIIATPGRLNDLVDRGVVSLSQVSNLVLDEGDRMLDMGFEVHFHFLS